MDRKLHDVLQIVKDEPTVIDSFGKVLNELRKQITQATSHVDGTTQVKINQIFDFAEQNSAGLLAAIVEGTPAQNADIGIGAPATPPAADASAQTPAAETTMASILPAADGGQAGGDLQPISDAARPCWACRSGGGASDKS